MAVVPDFLLKRIYKKGSLKQTETGIEFQLKNVLGPGTISGLEFIQINEHKFTKDAISFFTQGKDFLADCITEINPVYFRLGQEGTIKLSEQINCLKDGINKIIINLSNPEAGNVTVTFEDNLKLA